MECVHLWTNKSRYYSFAMLLKRSDKYKMTTMECHGEVVNTKSQQINYAEYHDKLWK